MMNLEKRQAFFELLRENNPHPETELKYSSPFELLIAVLLSAQATDISVNKGTRQLFKIANTPQALICNASSYDSGDAPLSFESTAPAAHYYKCPAGIQLGALTPNSNNLSPVIVLANADNMSTNGDGLEEDGISSLATYT